VPQTSIEDVFAAVQAGRAGHGVVPFENSSNGSVIFTLDLFADRDAKYPDILVCDEIYLKVQHCLLGRRRAEPAPLHVRNHLDNDEDDGTKTPTQMHPTTTTHPLHSLSHVTHLLSHPQAWGQCNRFLTTHLPSIERQDVTSTSRAAEIVAADPSGTGAAIASRIAAELHGLDILAEGIEDSVGNCTRFFVIRRRRWEVMAEEERGKKEEEEEEEEEEEGMVGWKTLVSFTIEHGAVGTLAQGLDVFKRYGLNLTSINTRPSGEGAWHYIFFVEFRGRRKWDEGRGVGAVDEALEELGQVAKGWRWLGSFRNATGRCEGGGEG